MGRARTSPGDPGRGRRQGAAAGAAAGAVALLALLAACGDGGGSAAATRTPGPSATRGAPTATATAGGGSPSAPGATTPAPPDTASPATQSGGAAPRCRTSELSARIGRPSPGAGQRNFPIVLTNTAGRTCTVRGYPGAAFVDASGNRLGPDPRRTPDTATTVTLAPRASAWAGLTYASPQISGARTALPKSLLVTPPDEREPLRVAWTAGEVPVAGNASSVFVTVLRPGTGG